jgi:hypothetical protein
MHGKARKATRRIPGRNLTAFLGERRKINIKEKGEQS